MTLYDIMWIAGGAFILLLQIFLSIKARRIRVRLFPSLLLLILTGVLFALTFMLDGWDAVGFLLLSLYSAVVLGISLALSIIIAIIKRIVCASKKKNALTDDKE